MKHTKLFALALALIPLAGFVAATHAPRQDAATLLEEIKKERDEVDPAKITQLGNLRTRAAAEGLIELYDKVLSSIYMRREVIKALGLCDGAAEAEQPALQKVTDVATGASEPELRLMALDVLGESRGLGKHFLRTIVESDAESDVRERAMDKLVRMSDASDKDFFERIFKSLDAEEKDKKKPKKGEEPEKRPRSLKAIRELAFEQIVTDEKLFDSARLAELARQKDNSDSTSDWERKVGVRRMSLLELERRKDKKLVDVAKEVYDDNQERSINRAEAARILAEAEGVKILPKFLEDGREGESVTGEQLRMALGDLVAKYRDDETAKKLGKMIGKGKPHEERFVLRALAGYKDDKLAKALVKEVQNATKKTPAKLDEAGYLDERNLTLLRLETVASMGEKSVIAELQEVVEGCKDQTVVAYAMDAIGTIRGKDSDWTKTLEGYVKSPKVEVRNAALMQLAKSGDAALAPVFIAAVEDADWSTRLAALEGLEAVRTPEAIGAMVARMDKESGLMLFRFADALFRLTGKPYRTSSSAWKAWWEKEGQGFKAISAADLQKLQSDEEIRRLKQVTESAKFFGIRIVSHRVLFIIDVSGSMNWELTSEQAAPKGHSRMEIAKEELLKCIDALDPKALFNITTFSSDVDRWLDAGVAAFSKANKDEAKAYVEKLSANGGTNIYGALKDAFNDPDVDTIFFLSDGEPSVGEETDQLIIRERAKEWNEHRKIVIHTIQVGGSFQILEWLAEDSGGTTKKIQ